MFKAVATKIKFIPIVILFFMCSRLNGQARIIYGRVLSEGLEVLPGVTIRSDTLTVGKTDTGGRFKISIPENAKTISFVWIGQEPTVIHLNGNCDNIEVIMMDNVIYDFISLKKINRLRLRRFNKLPALRLQAYKKGLFITSAICYTANLEPYK